MGNALYLARALEQAPGGALPVGVRTWDGVMWGPDTGPAVVLNNRRCATTRSTDQVRREFARLVALAVRLGRPHALGRDRPPSAGLVCGASTWRRRE